MDEKKIENIAKEITSDIKDIKKTKSDDSAKYDIRRFFIAIAISFAVLFFLSLSFVILSSASDPPTSNRNEQILLIQRLDDTSWKCAKKDVDILSSIFAVVTNGSINLEKGSGNELMLTVGEISFRFTLGEDALWATIGMDTVKLYYSEGFNGGGESITIRTAEKSVSLSPI